MATSSLPLLLASILAVAHFLADELEELVFKHREMVISFATGVSVSYIFTSLMPEFHRFAQSSSELIFIAPLIGFSSIHLVERHIARKEFSPERIREEYKEIHTGFLFLYYTAVGFLLHYLIAEDAVTGLLFFLPILFHTMVSSFSFSEVDQETSEILPVKIGISLAPLIGVLVHSADVVSDAIFKPLFGLIMGMFIYIVVRDSLPEGDRGRPLEFLMGLLAYLTVIMLSHFL